MIARIAFLIALTPLFVQGQDTLRFSEYKNAVFNFHPLIQQAGLAINRGEANLLSAKGGFDPKLEANSSSKYYKGKNYYNLSGAQLKYPTPFAVELKGAYDLNNGAYLDPSQTTSDQGLMTIGLSLPLLQGLITDERRATRKIADGFMDYSIQERNLLTNQVLLVAYDLYWQWWSNYEKTQMAREILAYSKDRFDNVKIRTILGQSAAFDTIEAGIQVGLRTQQLQELELQELKSRLMLSTMLWQDDSLSQSAVYIADGAKPDSINFFYEFQSWINDNFLKTLDSLQMTHPELMQYEAKLKMTDAELQWKREKVKPKLNLEYNLLAEPIGTSENTNFTTENYKWGLDFSFPLLARSARGELRMSQIKREEIRLSLQQKSQEIKNKAITSYRSLFSLNEQLKTAKQNVAGYYTLLDGERIRFNNGESSLFLLNQREIQYVEARIKYIDLQQKLIKNYLELAFNLARIQSL
ncbi:MAG: hypothetical protein RLZZ262_1350 [Bacteroidota bacterium]|jgi:outer membrane protein TolC